MTEATADGKEALESKTQKNNQASSSYSSRSSLFQGNSKVNSSHNTMSSNKNNNRTSE